MAMQIVHLLIVSTFLLQKRCSAEEFLCTVKESNGSTIYTVPKDKATGCLFSWTDSNGKVLRNQDSANETEGQSNRTFDSKDCYNQLKFSCTCSPEGQYNEAFCTTDCSRKEKGVGDQHEMENDPTKSANDNATPRHHWMLMVPVILFVLVLLLRLAFCYKDHNSRCISESGSNDSACVIV